MSKVPISKNDVGIAGDFFNIIEAYDAFNSGVKEKPGQATYLTGLDTKYGNAYQMSFSTRIFFDAFWLDEKAPMGGDPKFFLSTDNSLLDYWTSANRPSSGEAKLYFDNIEHNLNTAVYYTAAAINFLLKDYIGSDCGESSSGGDPMPPLGGGTGDKVGSRVGQYLFLYLFQMLGIISTLTALGVVKTLKYAVQFA